MVAVPLSTARDDVLAAIRAALPDVPEAERSDRGPPLSYERERPWGSSRGTVLATFEERVRDYGAGIARCPEPELAATIAGACSARGSRRLVIPSDLPAAWLPAGFELVLDEELDSAEIERLDGAITAVALAIAETATLVLDCGPGQGRRAISLLPDHHLCVVRAEQVVAGVPEAIASLGPRVGPGRAFTFVSGPSATSDIELERVEGVHGPRRLDVILVGDRGEDGV